MKKSFYFFRLKVVADVQRKIPYKSLHKVDGESNQQRGGETEGKLRASELRGREEDAN